MHSKAVPWSVVQLEQYKQLTNWVYTKVQNSDLDDAFLSKSAQLLKINPDVYTVWNYRRRALQPILEASCIPSDFLGVL